jgi:hypothetical protein
MASREPWRTIETPSPAVTVKVLHHGNQGTPLPDRAHSPRIQSRVVSMTHSGVVELAVGIDGLNVHDV